MHWYQETIIRLLIEAMGKKGCEVMVTDGQPPSEYNDHGLIFIYEGQAVFVNKNDIDNALHYAYRIEYEPIRIVKQFEGYLIQLHNKRKAHEDMGITVEE